MKVVPVEKIFTKDYLESLKENNDYFYGQDKCRVINNTLYMGLITARNIGYNILEQWIEDIHQ